MAEKIAIAGAGPGGYVAAVRAAQLGGEVTLIEEDNVGGTCLNWGCIPSKVLITTSRLLDSFGRAQEFGVRLEGRFCPDMQTLMERKEKVIRDQSKGIHELLRHHKVRYVSGKAFFERRGLVRVALPDGAKEEVLWDKLILAPGTRPLDFSGFPFDGNGVISSNDALGLLEVPQSVMILGGGVIGCEFAFIFSSLGSSVTVVEAMDRILPLPSVDEACSRVLHREMKKRKIRVVLKRTVEGVAYEEGKLTVTTGPSPLIEGLGERERQQAVESVEKLLVCVGRKPNTTGLGLENLGVKLDERGWIIADDHMETNVAGVYAVGDVLGPKKIMLAHVASTEGMVAAENALGGSRVMGYEVVPGAIFTLPEVANVGLTEAQAASQGIEARAETVLFRALGKAQVIGEIAGEAKIVSDRKTGKVLGVHLVGPHATDLIAEAAVAMKMGATVQDLANTIHAHPTLSEVMLETSLKSLDMSLHG
ncbi:MAG: dihydrolipoyl dehydrogenase [Syntrophobacteraceae bacterium]